MTVTKIKDDEIPYKISTFSNPLRIGYDADGTFNPEHIDFEVCCGFTHTQKSAKFICFIPIVINLVITACLIIFEMYIFSFISVLNIPACLAVIYGVWRCKYRWILPCILSSILELLLLFIGIILALISVFKQGLFDNKLFGTLAIPNTTNLQLFCLIINIIFGACFFLGCWVIWTMYFHYHYLKEITKINENKL